MRFDSLICLCLALLVQTCSSTSEKEPPAKVIQKDTLVESTPELPIVKDTIPAIDYDTSQWAEVSRLDASIVLDMRYATTNNFVKEQLYDCGRCFLRPEAAEALTEANQKLKEKGYRLKMFDCFRPIPVQQKLWDKFQNPSYVTPPSKGSMHNRGLAVDLTIVNAEGEELDMGTEFDFFGKEAHHTYTGHSETINQNRTLLKSTLESVGFKGIRTEWWHYSYTKKSYVLSDMLWHCH